jgi:hypothetical protein
VWRALALLALTGAVELVIPPGREALILDMLGGSAEMPGGCKLAGASVERTHVVARYACGDPAHAVVVELRHPRDGAAGAVAAGEIAVVPGAGAPPELTAAIADRVRARGDRWTWVTLADETTDPAQEKPMMGRPYRSLVLILMAVIPLAGVLLRSRLARRRSKLGSPGAT